MSPTPSIVAAEHVSGHRLRVFLADGSEKTIDLAKWLRGPVFEPLRDEASYRRFILDGWTVSWPNGEDIASETLSRDPGVAENAA